MNDEFKPLAGQRMGLADYEFARFGARAPAGTTLEQVMDPRFFSNHLNQIKPGCMIEVLSDDGGLDCTLRVLTVTATTAKCRLLRLYDGDFVRAETFTKDDLPDGFRVNYGGRHHKWRFFHGDGDNPVEHGFETESEAIGAALSYAKKAL